MGSSISFNKLLKRNATSGRDDEADDGEECVEVFQCSTEESQAANGKIAEDCETCKSCYTTVKDFLSAPSKAGLDGNLAQIVRNESVLEYIKVQEKLVVRIKVKEECEDRKAKDKKDKNKSYSHTGTGCVYITSDEAQEYNTCPLEGCLYNNGQSHKCYGGMIVYTNKHVILDNFEAKHCDVEFFYYEEKARVVKRPENNGRSEEKDNSGLSQNTSEDETVSHNVKCNSEEAVSHNVKCNSDETENCVSDLPELVIAPGFILREIQENKDLAGLRILSHDPELYNMVKKYSDLRLGAWSKIPEEIKAQMKKHVIIISHPHGKCKKISFGDLIDLEKEDKKVKGRKVTRYIAGTCPGSSGAPVLTGHYSYRPFVHSSSIKPYKMSYSY